MQAKGSQAVLAGLVIAALIGSTAPAAAGPPNCSPCYTPSLWTFPVTPQIPGLFKTMSMRWCAIAEAPTVLDPTLVCQPTLEAAMWRRLVNANECVMLPGALISLQSGSTQTTQVQVVPDPGPLGGPAGYIESNPVNVEDLATELWAAWEQCDMLWSGQTKGALVLNAWAITDDVGSWFARGAAVTGSVAFPWMAVADADWLLINDGQFNERSLAHEAGHVMDEDHVLDPLNLMETGGSGIQVTSDQRSRMRTYLDDHPSVDPPPESDPTPDVADYQYDRRGDGAAPPLDVYKVVVVDRTPGGGDVDVVVALAGLVKHLPPGTATYAFAMDVDGTAGTGLDPSELVPGSTLSGVELVGIATYDPGTASIDLALYGQSGASFVAIPGPHPVPSVNDVSLQLCGTTEEFPGPDRIDILTEIGITIPAEVLFALGAPAGDGAFPKGARVQVVASNVDSPPADAGPDVPGLLDFPAFVPPAVETAATALPDEVVDVAVGGFEPMTPLAVTLGELEIETGATTDGAGTASFPLQVPGTLAVGPRELAVHSVDPSDRETAETWLVIRPPGIPTMSLWGTLALVVLLLAGWRARRWAGRRHRPGAA